MSSSLTHSGRQSSMELVFVPLESLEKHRNAEAEDLRLLSWSGTKRTSEQIPWIEERGEPRQAQQTKRTKRNHKIIGLNSWELSVWKANRNRVPRSLALFFIYSHSAFKKINGERNGTLYNNNKDFLSISAREETGGGRSKWRKKSITTFRTCCLSYTIKISFKTSFQYALWCIFLFILLYLGTAHAADTYIWRYRVQEHDEVKSNK